MIYPTLKVEPKTVSIGRKGQGLCRDLSPISNHSSPTRTPTGPFFTDCLIVQYYYCFFLCSLKVVFNEIQFTFILNIYNVLTFPMAKLLLLIALMSALYYCNSNTRGWVTPVFLLLNNKQIKVHLLENVFTEDPKVVLNCRYRSK